MFFSLQNHALFLRLRTNPGGPGWARWAFLFFFRVLFLLHGSGGEDVWVVVRGEGFFFLLSGVECLERAGGRSSARTRVVRFFSCCQEGAWPGGWQDCRGFLGGFPLFFPCPPGGGLGGEPQARSSSFAFFFSVFASLAEAPALQAAEGGGVQLAKARFFPFVFPFFPARLAGPGAR